MSCLAYLLLSAFVSSSLLGADLAATMMARLRAEVGEVERLEVTVTPPPESSSFGDLGSLRAEIRGIDARRLPLAALVPTPLPRTPKGRLRSLELVAEDVFLETLRASQVTYRGTDLRFDLSRAAAGQLRVTGVGQQEAMVLLRDGDLDAHATAEFPEMMSPRITFEDGELVARAMVPLLFAAFPVTIRGKLAIHEGRQVLLREATIDTGRLELTEALRAEILGRLDPLIDLAELLHFPVPLTWTRIEVGDGTARIFGRLELPELPPVKRRFNPRARYLD